MRENTVTVRQNVPPRPPLRDGRSDGMLLVVKWLDENNRSLSWLAGQVGRSRQAVSAWDEVPPTLMPEISQITGIPPNKLRPDLFFMRSSHK